MLFTLHKYVTRTMLGSLAFCVAIIIGLTVLLDFVQRVDDFSTLLQNTTVTWRFIVLFYVIRLPMFTSWLAPVILLSATGVTVIRMNRNNEMIPFLMSGISTHQLLIPLYLIFVAGAVAVFSMQEWVLPSLSSRLAMTKKRLKEGRKKDDVLAVDKSGTFVQSSVMDMQRNVLKDVTLLSFKESKLKRIVTADRAQWRAEDSLWVLSNGRVTKYDKEGFRVGAPESFGTDGLEWNTELSPERIITRKETMQFHRLTELLDMIDKWPYLASIRMNFHSRLLNPVIVLLLPLISIPIFLRRGIRSYLIGSILIAGLAVGYYLLQMVFMQLGNGGVLHPVPASWIPVVLAISLLCYLMDDLMT